MSITSIYPITLKGRINYESIVKDPQLNVIEMVNLSDQNQISSMVCGGQIGTFVVQNQSPGSTTYAHEFGHSLGLPHLFNDHCESETPSIMCARGSYTLAKYQYDPKKKQGESGGTLNPIYRTVRAEDVLSLNISKIPYNHFGMKLIGPHMKTICDADHSSF